MVNHILFYLKKKNITNMVEKFVTIMNMEKNFNVKWRYFIKKRINKYLI